MLFDCLALTMSLYATYMSKWSPDASHTYGFMRYEVLAGFANSLFLLFIGFSIAIESIVRLAEPQDIQHIDQLIVVSSVVHLARLGPLRRRVTCCVACVCGRGSA